MKAKLIFCFLTICLNVFAQQSVELSRVCCQGNILKNADFASGNCSGNPSNNIDQACLPNWKQLTGSPQYSSGMGYSTLGGVFLWGTNTRNETVTQSVTFKSGFRYRISCAVKKIKPQNLPNHKDGGRFQFFVGNTKVAETYEMFSTTTEDWVFLTLPEWTHTGATGAQSFSFGIVSGVADKATFGVVDDVCLQELPPCGKLAELQMRGPAQVCVGESASFGVMQLEGTAYAWTLTPNVPFTGNGTSGITIPAGSLAGKSQVVVKVVAKCGGKDYTTTKTVKILPRLTDAAFALSATIQSNPSSFSVTGTPPSAAAAYSHSWVLYQSTTAFTDCAALTNAPTVVSTQNTTNFSQSGLIQGRFYMLRHFVTNCDGKVLSKNQCFNLNLGTVPQPGTNAAPLIASEGPSQIITDDDLQGIILENELRILKKE